ncbi:MAG TPA: cell division protein [Lactobacillus sp.]|nr:cell division protein [Lactobacillus sp.]
MDNTHDELFTRFQYANGTLKNKFGIEDRTKLRELDYVESAQNGIALLQLKPVISDLSFLRKIHKILFGELYEWAGVYRDYNLTKGSTTFLEPAFFATATSEINRLLTGIYEHGDPLLNYAKVLDAINNLHPFREGNGRSIRLFLQIFAANNGDYLDYSNNDSQIIEALASADIKGIAGLLTLEKIATTDDAFADIAKKRLSGR